MRMKDCRRHVLQYKAGIFASKPALLLDVLNRFVMKPHAARRGGDGYELSHFVRDRAHNLNVADTSNCAKACFSGRPAPHSLI